MSAADVQFLTITGDPCVEGERPARFTFRCVRRSAARDPRLPTVECAKLLLAEGPNTAAHGVKRDGQNLNGGRAQWDWDGNHDAPTLTPSINCETHCGWHGYIRGRQCVEANGTDSP